MISVSLCMIVKNEEDQKAFLALKETLDPAVSVVMAPYYTGFDENGNVTFSYYRERLMKNRDGMSWVGAVHEVVTPIGKVFYGDFAVTHRKIRPSAPDRNLRIYEAQLATGKELGQSDEALWALLRTFAYDRLGPRSAVRSATGFSSRTSTGRRPTGMRWP